MTTIIPIPAFTDNYVWLLRHGTAAVVVDPGDATPVQAALAREGLTLTAILATHHHGDHVGGIPALLARYPVPVFGPAHESIPGRTRAMQEGDTVTLPGVPVTLTTLDIPGHTAGHIAYFGDVDGTPSLFCGDTLFAAGCGRVFEGTPAQMWDSLSKLAALPDATHIYCGHEYTLANLRFAQAVEPGNADIAARQAHEQAKRDRHEPTLPSTMADERRTNPFLRAPVPAVRAAAERRAGRALATDADAFAALREWKNVS
ncbi:MAG: hydroxyacylglutathione hydrolase [Burkholderiales bacterium]